MSDTVSTDWFNLTLGADFHCLNDVRAVVALNEFGEFDEIVALETERGRTTASCPKGSALFDFLLPLVLDQAWEEIMACETHYPGPEITERLTAGDYGLTTGRAER